MSSLILNQKWNIAQAERSAVETLAREAGIPESLASFLALRGISSPDQALDHLSPRLAILSDPRLMKDMDRAVERLCIALDRGDKIGIFGDYDADGVTASALLHLFFREIGIETEVYLPHRETEGYGLNRQGIDWLASRGCSLVITVDCGITAVEEVRYASDSGIDMIITDHHQPGDVLPDAVAVLDPKRPECEFPFRELAGVGVAFNLARAFRARLYESGFFSSTTLPNLKKYLDLVAIGTVSDVVPLLGENRILVKTGLEVATVGRRPGVAALKKIASIIGDVDSMHLAFRIGPRINAAGRMDHARAAFDLLVTGDEREAARIASGLDALNVQRQGEERLILQEALRQIEEMGPQPAYILAAESWRRGVVGIVASRIMEKVCRPVVLLSVDGDEAVGSGRCPDALDLHGLLSECAHCLQRFGGHRAAAGMKLSAADIDRFRQAMASACERRLAQVDLTPALSLDARVTVDQLMQPAFAEMYQQLEPFGAGYTAPLFALHDFSVKSAKIIGKGHLKVILANGPGAARGISGVEIVGWGHGDKLDLPWEQLEVACEPGINVWNGRRTLQLRLMDARMNGAE